MHGLLWRCDEGSGCDGAGFNNIKAGEEAGQECISPSGKDDAKTLEALVWSVGRGRFEGVTRLEGYSSSLLSSSAWVLFSLPYPLTIVVSVAVAVVAAFTVAVRCTILTSSFRSISQN